MTSRKCRFCDQRFSLQGIKLHELSCEQLSPHERAYRTEKSQCKLGLHTEDPADLIREELKKIVPPQVEELVHKELTQYDIHQMISEKVDKVVQLMKDASSE